MAGVHRRTQPAASTFFWIRSPFMELLLSAPRLMMGERNVVRITYHDELLYTKQEGVVVERLMPTA